MIFKNRSRKDGKIFVIPDLGGEHADVQMLISVVLDFVNL